MALSDKEQRLLEQLEAALAADDPKLANTLRGAGTRTLQRRRAALAGLGFLAGVAALIAGMQFGWGISVLGFVIMLAATIVALTAWQRVENADERLTNTPPQPSSESRDPWRHDDERF